MEVEKSNEELFAARVLLFAMAPLAKAADLRAELMAFEKNLWTAWGKKDGEAFRKATTADAVDLAAGGARLVGRDAIVKEGSTVPCEVRSFAHADAWARRRVADVVVLSYTATQDASCAGKKLPPKIYVTSIDVKQKGKWLLSQNQETPAV